MGNSTGRAAIRRTRDENRRARGVIREPKLVEFGVAVGVRHSQSDGSEDAGIQAERRDFSSCLNLSILSFARSFMFSTFREMFSRVALASRSASCSRVLADS